MGAYDKLFLWSIEQLEVLVAADESPGMKFCKRVLVSCQELLDR